MKASNQSKRFTPSKDGVKRATLRVDVRVSREEWETLCDLARLEETEPVDFLYSAARDFIDWRLADRLTFALEGKETR